MNNAQANDFIKMQGVYEFKIYAGFSEWYMNFIVRLLGYFSQNWKLAFLDKYATVKKQWSVKNLITSAGKAQLALLAGDASAVPFTYLAVGLSSTNPAVANTALGSEITDSGLARAAATVSRDTTNVANDTLKLVYTWTASGSKTVEEIGAFNANAAGTMLGRALTGSSPLINTDTFAATYKVIFS